MPRAGVVAGLMESAARGRGGRTTPKGLGKEGAALLAGVPLFANLSKGHLRRLATMAEETSHQAGSTVVQAGQPGKAFYVIVEGRADIVRGTGKERRIARLGPGDFFGELALLDGGVRTASVVATTPLVTIRLSRGPFQRMVKSEPQVAVRLLEAVAARLRDRSAPMIE